MYFLFFYIIFLPSISCYGLGYRSSAVVKRQTDVESNLIEALSNPDGQYTGGYSSECSESVFITPFRKPVPIETSDEILELPKARCHWDIIGTDTCVPVLTCKKFKLALSPPADEEPCSDEHLEVTDGSGGYQRFCGNTGPVNLTTKNGLRDLYVTFVYKQSAGDKVDGRGFKCGVTCSLPEDQGTKTVLEDNFTPEKNEFCNCGRKPNGDRIVGGEDAKRGEFPWIVALVAKNTRKPYCGGTVINDRFVLTAAHCFKGPYVKSKNFQVLSHGWTLDLTTTSGTAGEGEDAEHASPAQLAKLNQQDVDDQSVRFDVDRYYIHPLYVRQTNDYDVALIKLKSKIDFQTYNFISPACMPNLGDYNLTYDNVQAIVAGWGLGSEDATSTMGVLQKLNVTVFTTKECKGFFDERISRRMMCAGFREGGKDSCKGDSGGPLISLKAPQLWQILGTVSWGEGCANKNSPGVYQRVSELNQWIRYVSNMGDGVWCRDKGNN